MAHRLLQAFRRLDKNQSGGLDQSEVPAQVWTHIQAADTDGDGEVTGAELRAFIAQHAQQHGQNAQAIRQAFQAADANGDHKLDATEWPATATALFSDVDANGDGFVTPAEVGRYAVQNGGQSPI